MKQGQGLILTTRGELKLTPLLQMSIKVLQMSNQEMLTEIDSQLLENPLLDVIDESPPDKSKANEQIADTDFSQNESTDDAAETKWEKDIPSELGNDSSWDDIYTGGNSSSALSTSDSDWDPISNQFIAQTLQQHLEFQLNLMPLNDADQRIARYIIDSIDGNGWLIHSLNDIVDTLNRQLTDESAIEFDEAEAVLHLIQSLEPTGVGARSLAECITLQLQSLDTKHPTVARAISAVRDHMDLISSQNFKKLAKVLNCSLGELELAIELIQMQNPYPGSDFSTEQIDYIVPDLLVKKINASWKVEVNAEVMPKLCVQKDYSALIKSRDKSDDNQYLRDKLQSAEWLIQSVENRFDTLLKVGACIVERQTDFFESGPEAMRPMIQADIAEALGFSESTISRAIVGKYMLTPGGVIELKYFFSSQLTAGEGETSSTAVRAIIKKLVSEEPPSKPLSDAKLTKLLEDRGIQVARRTVAKYRESLGIESSSKRKRLK